MRRTALAVMIVFLAGCHSQPDKPVSANDHNAFWLWAGVDPQPVLRSAQTLYILEGEVAAREPATLSSLRAAVPKTGSRALWMVVRVETLRWSPKVHDAVLARLETWRAAGNTVFGLQIDFDARTKHLEEYAAFIGQLRSRLPRQYRLSVTGLLDWSANGDPRALSALAPNVDEVVLQTYQGRTTIPGYRSYLGSLDGFPIPFRIGLVQGGQWREPSTLRANPRFRGYVVFLLNPPRRDDAGRILRH